MNDQQQPARTMQPPTSEEVIGALQSAGWLLEQEAESAFELRGFHTQINSAFTDPDDKSKSREIDVMAYKQVYRNEDLRYSIGVRCLVECKQSSKPYALVGKEPNNVDKAQARKEQVFRFPHVVVGTTELPDGRSVPKTVTAREHTGLQRLTEAPWNQPIVATQMTRLDFKKPKWSAENEGIFNGLVIPLAKATQHYRAQALNYGSSSHDPTRGDWASIVFMYPMVVTSADLYLVDANRRPYAAEKVQWAPLVRELKAGKLDGKYYIDIVNGDALDGYIDKHVLPFALAAQARAEADPMLFITSGNRVQHPNL
jgi:hypothetical protein